MADLGVQFYFSSFQQSTWNLLTSPSDTSIKSLTSFERLYRLEMLQANNSQESGKKFHPREILVPFSSCLLWWQLFKLNEFPGNECPLVSWSHDIRNWLRAASLAVNSQEIPCELITVTQRKMFSFPGFYACYQRTSESQFDSFIKLGNVL